jgi:FixJ family two-component response regulator
MSASAASVTTEKPIVFLIDDDRSLRAALEDLLNSAGLDVMSFASPREFLGSARPDEPACLVLDIKMPDANGLDFQKELIALDIRLPTVFITGHGDIPMSVRAMKAGAIEFLTKPIQEEALLDAIQAGIAKDRLRRRDDAHIAELRTRYETLSPREGEVMALVAAGRLNKQIAATLELSLVTIKIHRGRVMRKMQAVSWAELAQMARRLGLPSALS